MENPTEVIYFSNLNPTFTSHLTTDLDSRHIVFLAPPLFTMAKIPRGDTSTIQDLKKQDSKDTPILKEWKSIRAHARAIIARFSETDEKTDEFLQWNQQSSRARYHMVMKLTEKFRWLERFKDDWAAEVILRTRVKNAIAEHQRREKKRLEAKVKAKVIYTAPRSDDKVKVDKGTASEHNKQLKVC